MRFGQELPQIESHARRLNPVQVQLALAGQPFAFPDGPEQRFAFSLLMLQEIVQHQQLKAQVTLEAQRFMQLMVDTWENPPGMFYHNANGRLDLGNEPYWQMQVMRMLRPMGILNLMAHHWALGEFSAWVKLAKPYSWK